MSESPLESLSLDELRAVLAAENDKCEAMRSELTALQSEIQEVCCNNERSEQHDLNCLRKKIDSIRSRNDCLSKQASKKERHIKAAMEDKVTKMIKDSEAAQASIAEDNERLLETLQIKVDSNAIDTCRTEIELAHPISAKYVRITEDQVNPELWAQYKESENTRMNYMQRLSMLRQEIEHIVTVCALFVHRVTSLQIRLITGPRKYEMQKFDLEEDLGMQTPCKRRRHSSITGRRDRT